MEELPKDGIVKQKGAKVKESKIFHLIPIAKYKNTTIDKEVSMGSTNSTEAGCYSSRQWQNDQEGDSERSGLCHFRSREHGSWGHGCLHLFQRTGRLERATGLGAQQSRAARPWQRAIVYRFH